MKLPEKQREEIGRIIGEACGTVSMCWNPIPVGVFDSTEASNFVDKAVQEVESLIREILL